MVSRLFYWKKSSVQSFFHVSLQCLKDAMNISSKVSRILANIYLFEVNKRNTKQRYEICSKLTTKTPELRQMELSEKIVSQKVPSDAVLVSLLLTLSIFRCYLFSLKVPSNVILVPLLLTLNIFYTFF